MKEPTVSKTKVRTLVGIRPTGRLHLGHYFSVIKPALEYGADVLIADLHAPNVPVDGVFNFESGLVRFGVGGESLIRQSEMVASMGIPFIKSFFSILEDTGIGELERMTQFKSAQRKTVHLLIYPVLMAMDVGGYDRVVVGDDQKQHAEFIKRALGGKQEFIFTGKIMSLSDPTKKMSKSEPKGCLFLDDIPEEIRRKIRKAVTDKAGRKNLEFLYREFVGKEPPRLNEPLKEGLAEALILKFNA